MIDADLMASKRFRHLDQEWEAVGTGTGSAFGVGRPPIVTRWGVVFRSLSDPERGDYGYRGTVLGSDPGAIPEDQLKLALEEALIVAAIDRSRFTWRTAAGIAKETKILIARVQATRARPLGQTVFLLARQCRKGTDPGEVPTEPRSAD